MSERDYAPLSVACVRGLCDKIYEKRKFAGAEIEKMVKDFNEANNSNQIKKLLRVLGHDLMASSNPNVKNGALMGLSSVAVGLGRDSVTYLPELIAPVLACFSEAECRVRYQAVEALFNVVKITRSAAVPHVPQIFGALARLAADPEPQVKQAAELLDRLLKDVVTESPEFSLEALVPLVRERLYARTPASRQFVLSWLAALDAAPQLSLTPHAPALLDPLLLALGDPVPEIRRMCDVQLSEFLRGVKRAPECVDLEAVLNVLIAHAQAGDEAVQLTALVWLTECVSPWPKGVRRHLAGVLQATLPCLACHADRREIRETAEALNGQLMKLVEADKEGDECVDVSAAVSVLTGVLGGGPLQTRAAALEWLSHLANTAPASMAHEAERVFAACVARLADGADDVVRRALAVIADICERPSTAHFRGRLPAALLKLLAADESLLEERGAFIVRQLCAMLPPEDVLRSLAGALHDDGRLTFVTSVVRVLSALLLTAAELADLRRRLRTFGPDTSELFACLYRCWCHSPVSLVSLCLLTHNYHHCRQLLALFGDLEITVDLLTEIDKLVQLIESPVFAYLRLELLEEECGALRGCLYSLLMLLPQSDAFHTLRRRLQCCQATGHKRIGTTTDTPHVHVDFVQLIEHFKRVQSAHMEYRTFERRRTSALY